MARPTDLTVLLIETPTLGDRSYLVHDGEVAFVVDPQRDIDRVLTLLEQHGVRLTHVFETHIHNDYVTGGLALAQRTGAHVPRQRRGRRLLRPHPRGGREVVEVGGRMRVTALATPGHTFTHLSFALSTRLPRPTSRSACSPAGRCSTARPAGPTCSAPSTPTPWSTTSTPRPTGSPSCCPTRRRSTRRTASAPSAPPPSPTPRLDHRPGEAVEPRPHPGRGDLRRGAAGRPRPVAGLLRAHGAGQRRRPRRARPAPSVGRRRDRAAPAHRGRRVGRRPAPPHRLRRRATPPARSTSASTAVSRPTSAGSSPGAPRSRSSARPPRTSPRRSASWSASASTAPPRTPPAARGLERPRARARSRRHLRRPRPGAPPPRGRRPRRTPRRRARRRAHRRRRQHPAARAAGTASTRCRPGRSGCTAPVATAPRSPPRCSTPPGAPSSRSTTPSTTPSRSACTSWGPTRDRAPPRRRRRRAHRAQPGCARRRRLDPGRPRAPRARPVPAQATTGSLVVVGVTSLAGAVTARRAGNVLLARGIAFGDVAIGGAVAGAHALVARSPSRCSWPPSRR